MNETYKYKSIEVAYYIVATANERYVSINMTKIQKLLYIAYGISLAVTGKRLTNEHPQAWPYGPVFPTTRNKLLNIDLYSIDMSDPQLENISSDPEMKDLIKLVFDNFGGWTASQLTAWSHGEGTPWEKTVSQESFVWGAQIPDGYITSYFKTIIGNAPAE